MHARGSRTPAVVSFALAAATVVACGSDPIHERSVEELGPEDPNVPVGPLHRAGQPCDACHGGKGPAKSEFLLSGTIYATEAATDPLPNATVRFIDYIGNQGSAVTNCAGNFFVPVGALSPRWPLWFRVEQGDLVADMQSASFRERSCNECHRAPAGARTTKPVYLSERPFERDLTGCP